MQEPTAPSRQQASGRRRVPGGGAGWGQTGKQRASQPVGRRAPACWGAWENKLDKSKSKMDRRSAHNTAGRHHPAVTPPGAGCRPLALGHTLGKRQNCSTRGSQVIPQPSTSLAQPCLTSEC